MVVLVTLACCYAACWGPTRERGRWDAVGAAGRLGIFLETRTVAPLIVSVDYSLVPRQRHYYFWFFGYVAKLPYERDIKPVVNGVSGAT